MSRTATTTPQEGTMFVSGYQHHPTSFANLDLSAHEIVNDLDRRADRLAPRFSYECLESSCTNLRPDDHEPRRQKVWDLHAEALAWNMICDRAELSAQVITWLRQGLEVTVASSWGVYTATASDGQVIESLDRDAQIRRAYEEAGIPWTSSGGKVWPSGSEYDAECEPCVKGFAHIHPAPQAPLFEVVAEVAYDEATDALVPQGDGQYRCPECDTYSGTFDLTQPGEIIHDLCGRAGSPASFTRGTPEYDRVYDHQEEPSWGDEGQGGELDEDAHLGEVARKFLYAMSTQAWADIAPHLTCAEAEAAAAMLEAAGWNRNAEVLLATHAATDEEGDAHWQA